MVEADNKNMKTVEWFKHKVWLYERAFWYVSQAKGELLKPLGFWNETLLILTWLSVRYKFDPEFSQVIVAYLAALLLMAAAGKVLALTGVIKYGNKINNHQNQEFMEILEGNHALDKKVDELGLKVDELREFLHFTNDKDGRNA